MKVVVLDRALAQEYIRLHGQSSVIGKRMDEIKKQLLPQLVDGAVSPSDLPALLVNKPQNRAASDWKGYALSVLVKLYRRSKNANAKAAAELSAVDAAWPRNEIPALHVIINPDYVDKTT